jgi:N-acylglucosamine 2-epimerase
MNRRTFVGSMAMGPLMGFSAHTAGEAGSGGSREEKVTELAGKPLGELRDEYRHDLFEEFLPLMDRYVIDHREGGFQCELNADGTHPDEDKNTWFQGRGIWVYSYLYRHFGKRPEHLEVARRAVELVMKSRPSGEGEMWPAKLSRDGRPAAPPLATIGVNMAIAEGLGEYARASGQERYGELARQMVANCARAYDRPDYAPQAIAMYRGAKVSNFPGARTQGVSMLLFSTAGPMLEGRADAALEAILEEAVGAVRDKLFNPDFRLNNEILNHDYSRPSGGLAQFVYTGHCVETLGLLLREATRTRNQTLFQTAAERFHRHAHVAWDDVYGGAYLSLNNVDENQWMLGKNLWVQEEILAASLHAAARTGADWARRLYRTAYEYVRSKYYLKRWGFNFWISAGDRKVTEHPNLTRVEHYHHPRHLMFGLQDLEGLMARGGALARDLE